VLLLLLLLLLLHLLLLLLHRRPRPLLKVPTLPMRRWYCRHIAQGADPRNRAQFAHPRL
jgi:hypothetical protein